LGINLNGTKFQGNLSVSKAKQVFKGLQLGREGIIKSAVVNEGLPIRDDDQFPVRNNSTILFGEFPEQFAVKGVVHDAAVNLYQQETDFNELGKDPDIQEVLEILEGSIEGRRNTTSELRNRISNLEKKYGITSDEILDYEFESGGTVRELIHDIAEYRDSAWRGEAGEYLNIEPEVPLFDLGMSGRMDAIARRHNESDQIMEFKLRDETSVYDEFQASAYWLMNGDEEAEVMIEYPLIDERLRFNPGENSNDFDPREQAFDVYRSRDKAISIIEELRELQTEYFEQFGSRQKATREALKDLEVR